MSFRGNPQEGIEMTKNDVRKSDKRITSKKEGNNNLNKHPEVIRLRNEQIKELNEYLGKNRFYAYDDPVKFDEGMRMLGLDPKDTDKIVDVGGGAMRADKVPELKDLIARQKTDLKNLKKKLMAEMSA